MSEKRTFTCIICPNGCMIETEYEGTSIRKVSGNRCRRGLEYVTQELTDPRRTIAGSVVVENGTLPLCSVRVTAPVPKKEIFRVMEEIRKIHLEAPTHSGDVLIHHVCGYESDVIVTKNVSRQRPDDAETSRKREEN